MASSTSTEQGFKPPSMASRLKDMGLKTRLSRHAYKMARALVAVLEENSKSSKPNNASANMRLIVPIFFEPAQKWRARFWGVVYIIVMLSDVFIDYFSTVLQISLSTSLEYKDPESFFYYIWYWNIAMFIRVLQSALVEQSKWEVRMIVQWRLTFYLTTALYSGDTYYHMHSQQGAQAPESLICNEGFLWLHQTVYWIHSTFQAITMMSSSAYMLVFKMPIIATYMVCTVPLRGIIAKLIWPSRLGHLFHMNLQTGWDLQITMGRVADSAEQIALLRGGSAELRRFEGLMNVSKILALKEMLWQRLFEVGNTIAGTLLMLPAYYIMLERILSGKLTVSAAMNYAMKGFTMQMYFGTLATTSLFFNKFETSAQQMLSLLEAGEKNVRKQNLMDFHARTGTKSSEYLIVREDTVSNSTTPELDLRGVTLWTPGENRQIILKDLSCQLSSGQSLLVIGNTGIGKSVLLRGIHGLWKSGCGMINRCPSSMISCVPQRPFMFTGTLRENLLYPQYNDTGEISDEKMLEVLACVNLNNIVEGKGLHNKNAWGGVLSLGQQQRLGVARVLLKTEVRLLLLDEATSALDMQNEKLVYKLIHEKFPCYISVAHRPSVRQYHTHVIVMEFNEKLQGGLADATFLPIGDLDIDSINRISASKLTAATEEERLWALKRTAAEEKAATNDAPKAEKKKVSNPEPRKVSDAKSGAVPSGIAEAKHTTEVLYGTRRWGGVSLIYRGFVDVVAPMVSKRYTYQPLLLAFAFTYGCSYLSLSMEMLFNYPYSQIIKVLQTKNRAMVWKFYLSVILPYYPAALIVGLISETAKGWLHTVCRLAIKTDLAKRYLDGKTDAYYHMNLGRFLIGNPGARISTWDTDAANGWISGLITTTSTAVFATWIACNQLYAIHQSTLVIFLFFIATGAIITVVMCNKVFTYYRNWLEKTMELFTRTLEVRENAEAVAMLRGSDNERGRAYANLDAAINPGSMYLWLKDCVDLFGNTYFSHVIRIILANSTGPLVLNGDMSFDQQNMLMGIVEGGCGQVHALCTGFFLNVEGQVAMERLWEIAAVTHHITKSGRGIFGKGRWGGDIVLEEDVDLDCALSLEDFTLRTPANPWLPSTVICDRFSMRVERKDSLLIAGESGIGKSSVLRAVAGLWRHGEGTIRVPQDTRSYFIPQRPYMFCGTLREQLLYPGITRRDIDDDKLIEAVRRVELSHLLAHPGLGEYRHVIEKTGDVTFEKDRFWFFRLSLGEVQRLSFARLLLKEDIQLVFLDEATSALSTEAEEAAYGFVRDKSSSYISVAHRPQLRKFHNKALVLQKNIQTDSTDCRVMPMAAYEEELRQLAAIKPSKGDA